MPVVCVCVCVCHNDAFYLRVARLRDCLFVFFFFRFLPPAALASASSSTRFLSRSARLASYASTKASISASQMAVGVVASSAAYAATHPACSSRRVAMRSRVRLESGSAVRCRSARARTPGAAERRR